MAKITQEAGHESAVRILDAATRLFAEKGFHGVTTRQIAAAAGLNMATVHHHLGAKKDVYMAVLRRLYAREAALVQKLVDEAAIGRISTAEHLRRVLLRLADVQIGHVSDTPELAWLYVRRWLETAHGIAQPDNGDAEAVAAFEVEQSRALFTPLRAVLVQAEKRGLAKCQADAAFIIRGFDWLLYAYFTCGPVDGGNWRGDPHSPRNLRKFKKFIHAYLLSMLGLAHEV